MLSAYLMLSTAALLILAPVSALTGVVMMPLYVTIESFVEPIKDSSFFDKWDQIV